MTHDTGNSTSEATAADLLDDEKSTGAHSVFFYVLTVVLTAGNAMLLKLGNDGFWFMESAFLPLAFLLCLLGPNRMLPTGTTMMVAMFVGWFIVSSSAAPVVAYFGVFLVVANAALIFVGAFLGSLLRTAIIAGVEAAAGAASDACSPEEPAPGCPSVSSGLESREHIDVEGSTPKAASGSEDENDG